jgi:uncharacterized protein (DUF2147 family)
MRTLVAIAALALITTSAQAKVHEIKLGGRTTRIEVPSSCKKISCIQVLRSEKSASRSKRKGESAPPVAAVAAPVAAAAATTAVAPPPAPVARTEPRTEPKPESKVEPQAQSTPPAADERKSVARLSLPAQADQPRTVVAAVGNPSVADEPKAEPAKSAAPSPLGVWITEKRDGRIRIEPCGEALCGFVDGKPNDKVLIDMKAGSNNRWNGKIKDIRSGSVYAAHIALKGANALSVQGCAFGGMFCGGQTWTRAE